MSAITSEIRQFTPEELRQQSDYLHGKGWRELEYTAARWRDPLRFTQILKTHEAIDEQLRRDAKRAASVKAA